MSVDRMAIVRMTMGRMAVERVTIVGMSIGRMSVGRMSVDRVAILRMAIVGMAVGRVSINPMAFMRMCVDRVAIDRVAVHCMAIDRATIRGASIHRKTIDLATGWTSVGGTRPRFGLRRRLDPQADGDDGNPTSTLDDRRVGELDVTADFARAQALNQTLQNLSFARSQFAPEQLNDLPGFDLPHDRVLSILGEQQIACILVLRQFDPESTPLARVNTSTRSQAMTHVEGTTLDIPTQGLPRPFPFRFPEMDHRLLQQIFAQEWILRHPIHDLPQLLPCRRFQHDHTLAQIVFGVASDYAIDSEKRNPSRLKN